MHGITLLLIATIGVDVGWKPVENGELEYIIQIAPDQLRSFKAGDVIEVGVRPMLRPVRRYRIIVGTDPLPRQTARPEITTVVPDPKEEGPPQTVSNDAGLLKIPSPAGVDPQSLDHSVVVAPQNENKVSDDSRWIAANEVHDSLQLQAIPTRPIEPLVELPVPANQLNLLPPPPAATPATPVPPMQEVVPLSSPNDTFVPDYRRQGGNTELVENQEDYHLGDSVSINDGNVQTSGVVPPTPRLMLPPPPAAVGTAVPGPLQLPPPPDRTEPSSAGEWPPRQTNAEKKVPPTEQPSVLKAVAAPPVRPERMPPKSVPATPLKNEVPDASKLPPPPSGHSGGTWLVLALFASIGGNIFLGYITWDIRKRFLAAFRKPPTDGMNQKDAGS